MKFYAVHWYWDGADSEEPMTEWFTSKTEAIARAKKVAIDNEDNIRGISVRKTEVSTTKKDLLEWLNDCSGVSCVPGNHTVWEQPSDGKWGSE
tara:strand:+ start:486 stop:764 length:279 start_codon:yes stop_codon:yes gene_type:complete